MVSVLQYPGLHAATRRIELSCILIDLQKDFLHQVFGFSAVPQNPPSHAENLPIVPVEKNSQGIRNAASELLQKILVSCFLQVQGSHPSEARFREC